MRKTYQVTQKKLVQLKRREKYLEKRRIQLNDAWQKAVAEGDDRETDALSVAIKLLHENELDRRELKEILQNAVVVDESETPHVDIGTKLKIEVSGKIIDIRIVDPIETDPSKDMYSLESPLGKALSGLKSGDTTHFKTPSGEKVVVKVVSLD